MFENGGNTNVSKMVRDEKYLPKHLRIVVSMPFGVDIGGVVRLGLVPAGLQGSKPTTCKPCITDASSPAANAPGIALLRERMDLSLQH